MNKKIEDAIETYDKYKCCNPSWVDGFKDGAEWALREAIEHFKNNFNSVQLLNKHGINKELEQLLSSEGEK